jgi:hypothetical protein
MDFVFSQPVNTSSKLFIKWEREIYVQTSMHSSNMGGKTYLKHINGCQTSAYLNRN